VSNKNSAPDEKFLPGRAGDKGDPTNKQAMAFCPTAENLQSKMRPEPMPGQAGAPIRGTAVHRCSRTERTLRSTPRFFGSKKAPVASSPRFLIVWSHFYDF
jgi:hypothetical protein